MSIKQIRKTDIKTLVSQALHGKSWKGTVYQDDTWTINASFMPEGVIFRAKVHYKNGTNYEDSVAVQRKNNKYDVYMLVYPITITKLPRKKMISIAQTFEELKNKT